MSADRDLPAHETIMVRIGDSIWITPMDRGFLRKETRRYERGQLADLLAQCVTHDDGELR